MSASSLSVRGSKLSKQNVLNFVFSERPLSRFAEETVVHIHHWNEKLFSFRTTRTDSFKFRNGHFVMLGLELDSGPLTRAYSIASANYEENLEFFSIKVENGPLTSRLQNLKLGQKVIMSKKPVGTLVTDDLNPGKRLILLATGTGLAPFISITKDQRYTKSMMKSYSFTA